MKPKWQEDSSCVFAYYFVAALAIAAIPQEKIVYSQIRRRADHRTPAESSAAEFSGLVSATAPPEQGTFAPCGSVLTWHK